MRLPTACRRIPPEQLQPNTRPEANERPSGQPAESDSRRMQALLQQASECQVALEQQLQRLASSSGHRRMAQALLILTQLEGDPSGDDDALWIRITHQDLAYVAVSAVDVTDRILEEFTRNGLITQSHGRIRIDDPDRLEQLANAAGAALDSFTPPVLPHPS